LYPLTEFALRNGVFHVASSSGPRYGFTALSRCALLDAFRKVVGGSDSEITAVIVHIAANDECIDANFVRTTVSGGSFAVNLVAASLAAKGGRGCGGFSHDSGDNSISEESIRTRYKYLLS
jgi:hypothetical protein